MCFSIFFLMDHFFLITVPTTSSFDTVITAMEAVEYMDEDEPFLLVLSSHKTEFPSWIVIKQLIPGYEVNSHRAWTCFCWTTSLASGHIMSCL